jgi:hypothetical protein
MMKGNSQSADLPANVDRHTFYDRDDLLEEGWSEHTIAKVLDGGDQYTSANHWLNQTGSPLYNKERVAVAAYREGLSTIRPPGDVIHRWLRSDRPTSTPLLTMNFNQIVNLYEIRPLRDKFSTSFANPTWGPFSSSGEKSSFIKRDLVCLAHLYLDVEINTWQDFIDLAAANADRILATMTPEWRDHVCIRPARIKKYVSRARGAKALHKAFDALLLVQAGVVTAPDGALCELVDLLMESRLLRFDTLNVD